MSKDTNQGNGTRQEPNLSDLAIRRMFGVDYQYARLTNWVFDSDPDIASRQRDVLDAVQEMCDGIEEIIHSGQQILITGQCGTGKDRLLVSLCRAALAHIQDASMVTRWRGADLWMRIRDGITARELEADILKEVTAPAVLAISDPIMPGQEGTSLQQDWLYRILDRRQSLGRPTWFTTNAYDMDELVTTVGAANFSRMKDNAILINCDWDEFRAPLKIV